MLHLGRSCQQPEFIHLGFYGHLSCTIFVTVASDRFHQIRPQLPFETCRVDAPKPKQDTFPNRQPMHLPVSERQHRPVDVVRADRRSSRHWERSPWRHAITISFHFRPPSAMAARYSSSQVSDQDSPLLMTEAKNARQCRSRAIVSASWWELL